jgi:SagB-type dehydrogenase family enzyme
MDELPSTIEAYHLRSKHFPQRYAEGPAFLDWDCQPNPFRRYAGAREVPLPLLFGAPAPAFHDLGQAPASALNEASLGLFLELALGLSAWKEVPGARWAVRNNPSSGNLHPTEGWLVLPALAGIGNVPALYHYAPFEHALEERCVFEEAPGLPEEGFFLALSSVAWREAWKYGERAFRYCQHDAGHALASAAYAAACLGWRAELLASVDDDTVTGLLGLDRPDAAHAGEREYADLIAFVRTHGADKRMPELPAFERWRGDWFGTANRLSEDHEPWPAVTRAAALTHKPRTEAPPILEGTVTLRGTRAYSPGALRSAAAVIRNRRSVQNMDNQTAISRATLERLLAATLPDLQRPPWSTYPWAAGIALFVFVHRVEGLTPGLYALLRSPTMLERLRAACDPAFSWAAVPGMDLPFYALREGDFRKLAAALSCHQGIAGRSAFSLGMVADFARTLKQEGPWSYRRLFWEAGTIGHVLYLEATAANLSGTGIGCYFDDEMHRLLGLSPGSIEWQSLYHFTVGGGYEDSRVSTSPPYAHLDSARAR